MTRSDLTRVLQTAGVALLPAVAILCCVGQADAGCGNYVQVVGPDGGMQSPGGHDPMPAERPCQGPECTGGPKAPAPAPPAQTGPTSDVKGLVGGPADADRTAGRAGPAAHPDASPVRRPSSIFH